MVEGKNRSSKRGQKKRSGIKVSRSIPIRRSSVWQELKRTVAKLRHPQHGCPWDREQTMISLTPYILEEAQEVTQAILNKDRDYILEELGDLLYQVMIQSQIAEEKGWFSVEDVVNHLRQKLVRRHPHVFAQVKASSVEEVRALWSQIKEKEKQHRARVKNGSTKSKKKPKAQDLIEASELPGFLGAYVLGEYSAALKFDWPNAESVFKKVREEFKELSHEVNKGAPIEALKHEVGDLIFALIQWSRHIPLDLEKAVRLTNKRFVDRFLMAQKLSGLSYQRFINLSASEKEKWYIKAKKRQSINPIKKKLNNHCV